MTSISMFTNLENVLRSICFGLEFSSRAIFVNIPFYLQAHNPELDRICAILFAYLTIQVVGFVGACLTNAMLTLACRVTAFLPPLAYLAPSIEFNQTSGSLVDSFHTSPYSMIQLIANYYVSYASIRIMVSFIQGVFNVGLESIKDFPDACKVLADGGMFTLQMSPIMFLPAIILEFGLLLADPICSLGDSGKVNATSDSSIMHKVVVNSCHFSCDYTGMRFLTSPYSDARRVVFGVCVIMILQLWQAALHQFPNWNRAVKSLHFTSRISHQIAVFVLGLSTFITLLAMATMPLPLIVPCVILTGWTIWLFHFTPVLVRVYGHVWAAKVNPASLQALAANLRMSFILMIGVAAIFLTTFAGLQRAQLDLTFITFAIPATYCTIYLCSELVLQAGPSVLSWGLPSTLLVSVGVHSLLDTSSFGGVQLGRGSVLLVWAHLMIKLSHFFGEGDVRDGDAYSDEELYSGSDSARSIPRINSSASQFLPYSKSNEFLEGIDTTAGDYILGGVSITGNRVSHSRLDTAASTAIQPPGLARSMGSIHSKLKGSSVGLSEVISRQALSSLVERGQEESSLVSLGISQQISDHFLVRFSRRHLRFLYTIARALAVSDSTLSGVIRGCVASVVISILIVGLIAVGSFAQKHLELFPRIVDLHLSHVDSSVTFNHKVSNVTLYFKEPNSLNRCARNESKEFPYYAGCDWRWDTKRESSVYNLFGMSESKPPSLTLFDFALFSELAYYDSSSCTEQAQEVEQHSRPSIQKAVDLFFPNMGFEIRHKAGKDSKHGRSDGPQYIEARSEKLNLTVIAVRGTDMGRLIDFLEDVRLYSEPMIFHLLSVLFPTIRLWTSDTTSRVIEWMFQFNSFIGLQSESHYYRPLAARVLELTKATSNSTKSVPGQSAENVIITGHSLGGGLARIVGSLTQTPSITFAPPGLGLSYRKYSLDSSSSGGSDGARSMSSGDVHHQSVAVITEFDW